jgi:hypothetical protein
MFASIFAVFILIMRNINRITYLLIACAVIAMACTTTIDVKTCVCQCLFDLGKKVSYCELVC